MKIGRATAMKMASALPREVSILYGAIKLLYVQIVYSKNTINFDVLFEHLTVEK